MPEVSPISEPSFLPASISGPTPIQRTPLYFQSQGAWLFAWLHQNEPASQCHHGVIICPPLGYEQIHSHRGLRHLADALAAAGFPVLRFDYHGTGDSAGVDEDADRHAVWLANIRSAMCWMRRKLDCALIDLVGVRLGAAWRHRLPSLSRSPAWCCGAGREGTCLCPRNEGPQPEWGGAAEEGKDIEAAGFVITEQTARALGGIDLLQTRPKCRGL